MEQTNRHQDRDHPWTHGSEATNDCGAHTPGDTDQGLTEDLQRIGWRKIWSRREERPYYFNKLTNESRWEMPSLNHFHHGVNRFSPYPPVTTGPAVTCHDSCTQPQRPAGHMRLKEDVANGTVPTSQLWNFETPQDSVMFESISCVMTQPHPDIEKLRAQLVSKLRHTYRDLCQSREGIDAPAESFNRWLLERKLSDQGDDPLLPSHCEPVVSPSMYREIVNDIPVRLVKPRHPGDARKHLLKYAEAAMKMVESRSVTPDGRKVVKWNVEDALSWLRDNSISDDPDTEHIHKARLIHLKAQCKPHLVAASRASVEAICTKVYNAACDMVKTLRERKIDIAKGVENEDDHTIPDSPKHPRLELEPDIPSQPRDRLTHVQLHIEGQEHFLTYRGERLKLDSTHVYKLEQLYRLSCHSDPHFDRFLGRIWILLRRYHTMFGDLPDEGLHLQSALPVNVFDCLQRNFDVTFECFASPFNCYFRQYCSAFLDTDACFGSKGPLLKFRPRRGSFEANPPFIEELMDAMVIHFEELLSESWEPLSFAIFIPDWNDPPTAALVRLESSRFNRKKVVLLPFEHEYRHGFKQLFGRADERYKAVHGTVVVFLQNAAGFERWRPTEQKVKELVFASKPIVE